MKTGTTAPKATSKSEMMVHEAKLAKYVFELVEESIKEDATLVGRKLEKIIFDLSVPYTVYPDSFEFYFTELVKGTSYENVVLQFRESSTIMGFFINSLVFED